MTLSTAARPTVAVGQSASPLTNATLVGRHDFSAGLATFRVSVDEAIAVYQPGQYVALSLAGDGPSVTRPYSIVSLRGRTTIELLVRRLANGALSARLWRLPIGSRLRVGPPRGLFVVPATDARPRLYVAGGTGVAPFMAMLEAAARAGDGVPTTLIHGVSYAAELCFADRLSRWRAAGLPLDYRPSVSRPAVADNTGWIGRIGRAEEQLGQLLEEGYQAGAAWLCGPAPMVEASRSLLLHAGLSPDAVRVELFHRPTLAA